MSSKFHVFLWCTKCLPAGTAHSDTRPTFFAPGTGGIQKQSGASRNRFHPSTGRSRTHRTAFKAMPKMPCPKYWRDSKHDGVAFPGRIAFPQVLAVPKRSHNHVHNAFPQVLAGVATESLLPNYGHFQNPPYCIQNHAENALPQVMTEFRAGNRFPPNHTHKRDSESINGMAESLSPKYTGGSWTHSGGWPFPGCRVAGRCEERNTVFPRGVNLEDRTKRRAPFGGHAGCQTAQNGKLEDWVSGPSVPERTFKLSGFDHKPRSPKSQNLNPKTQNPEPQNPKPQTLNPKTLNPKTLNPKKT